MIEPSGITHSNAFCSSGLFEIPESDRERRSPTDQRSLTSTPVSPLRFQSRIGSARAMGNARTSKDDVYSDLPIGNEISRDYTV